MFRLMPALGPDNEFFWTSGRDGKLRFKRCQDCAYYIHPPTPVCPKCWSRNVAPEEVSGMATLHSFTINHQKWSPDIEEPYAIALVVIDEQDDVRLTTNLVGIPDDEVEIGMRLTVTFEDHDPVFIPLFERAR